MTSNAPGAAVARRYARWKPSSISEKGRKINRSVCNLCLKCAEVCPTGAMAVTGQWMTLEEVMKEVDVRQPVLQELRRRRHPVRWRASHAVGVRPGLAEGVQGREHSTLRSIPPAMRPGRVLDRVLDYTDLVLYDIKHMDPVHHREGTGKSNGLILDNARRTAAKRRTLAQGAAHPRLQ